MNLGEQYPQLKADADDLGREYNELNNKALKARDAAKAKDAEWAAARDARDEAQADLDAAKNLPSVEDAETALKDAKKLLMTLLPSLTSLTTMRSMPRRLPRMQRSRRTRTSRPQTMHRLLSRMPRIFPLLRRHRLLTTML